LIFKLLIFSNSLIININAFYSLKKVKILTARFFENRKTKDFYLTIFEVLTKRNLFIINDFKFILRKYDTI